MPYVVKYLPDADGFRLDDKSASGKRRAAARKAVNGLTPQARFPTLLHSLTAFLYFNQNKKY
jgi:hypothetical protein